MSFIAPGFGGKHQIRVCYVRALHLPNPVATTLGNAYITNLLATLYGLLHKEIFRP